MFPVLKKHCVRCHPGQPTRVPRCPAVRRGRLGATFLRKSSPLRLVSSRLAEPVTGGGVDLPGGVRVTRIGATGRQIPASEGPLGSCLSAGCRRAWWRCENSGRVRGTTAIDLVDSKPEPSNSGLSRAIRLPSPTHLCCKHDSHATRHLASHLIEKSHLSHFTTKVPSTYPPKQHNGSSSRVPGTAKTSVGGQHVG